MGIVVTDSQYTVTNSVSLTVTGHNRYLIVVFGYNAGINPGGVTWNGTTVPVLVSHSYYDGRALVYGLVNPEPGTYLVASGSTVDRFEAICLNGVDQNNPISGTNTFNASATVNTITQTTIVGDWVFGAVGHRFGKTAVCDQIVIYTGGDGSAGYVKSAPTVSTILSFTGTGSTEYAIVSVAVTPAAPLGEGVAISPNMFI